MMILLKSYVLLASCQQGLLASSSSSTLLQAPWFGMFSVCVYRNHLIDKGESIWRAVKQRKTVCIKNSCKPSYFIFSCAIQNLFKHNSFQFFLLIYCHNMEHLKYTAKIDFFNSKRKEPCCLAPGLSFKPFQNIRGKKMYICQSECLWQVSQKRTCSNLEQKRTKNKACKF